MDKRGTKWTLLPGFPMIIDPTYITRVELEDACSLLAAFLHCQQYRRDYAATMTAYEGAHR